jgi:hypothetical protein
MSTKLNYQLLTAAMSVETMKYLFEKEAQFLKEHVWLFAEQQPQLLLSWNNGALTFGELQQIRSMMENVKKQEEQQKKVEALYNPAALTSSHRAGY